MKQLSQTEIKEALGLILSTVARFCDENSIQYFLAWGTLIGAVRHHGFIPWDDDIDIWMPRPDYNRFIKLYKNQVFRFRSMQTEPDFPLCFGKVCDERYSAKDEFGKDFGLYVDVFPLDGLPANPSEVHRHFRRIRRLETMWSSQVLTRRMQVSAMLPVQKNFKIVCAKLLHPFLSIQRIQGNLSRLYEKYKWEDSESVIDFSTDKVFKKTMFHPAEKGFFEGQEYLLPGDFDSVLRIYYGDYMILPPEEKRYNHGIVAFLK